MAPFFHEGEDFTAYQQQSDRAAMREIIVGRASLVPMNRRWRYEHAIPLPKTRARWEIIIAVLSWVRV